MNKGHSITRILIGHFFRRFFDNDTVQADGDTLTTVVRAVSIVAVPGLMVPFFLQTHYRNMPLWEAIEVRYFFVLLSFVVMGAVSIFEWEMLFPDRLDFLVLSPLSLRPTQMLAAKAAALVGFLALFLVGCNLFAMLLLPAVGSGGFLHQMVAHGAAVLLAGIFAASFVLALGGVLLCVLGATRFRMASPIVQMLSVTALALFLLQFAIYGDTLRALLSGPHGMARWMPPFWFLGLYEQLLEGDAAPAFAREMARYALRGTAIAAALVLLTYPTAWTRMRRMAVEGATSKRGQPSRWIARLVHSVIRRPGERAVFHFIGQTIARNNRYQVYLAMYCGTGLAFAVACAVTFHIAGGSVHPALSQEGLHAIVPFLLFWTIAGLRTAFAFPLNLAAGWVFRVTGAKLAECASGARKWVFACAVAVMCCILAALRAAGWDARHLLVQAVCGLCLCVLLIDGLFFSQEAVPFNQPRLPGRTNFPLMLTLYVGVLPFFGFLVAQMGMHLDKKPSGLLLLALAAALVHTMLLLRTRSQETEEEMEGYEGEFQLLGLS
ncbi:MAG: hypothetical protein ABR910_17445 [Acidobacteriaceae bacterium]|jgi:hypothetical protein